MNPKHTLTTALILSVAAVSASAVEVNDADLAALKKQLSDLDQKVRVLEREREIDSDAAVATAKTAPKISLGASGFNFSSGDSNFVAQLHAVAQFDSRSF